MQINVAGGLKKNAWRSLDNVLSKPGKRKPAGWERSKHTCLEDRMAFGITAPGIGSTGRLICPIENRCTELGKRVRERRECWAAAQRGQEQCEVESLALFLF